MNDKCFQYIVNLHYDKCLFIQTLQFYSAYNGIFSNFSYYKCLFNSFQ